MIPMGCFLLPRAPHSVLDPDTGEQLTGIENVQEGEPVQAIASAKRTGIDQPKSRRIGFGGARKVGAVKVGSTLGREG